MKQDQLDIRCLRTPCDDRAKHGAEAAEEAVIVFVRINPGTGDD